jgi:hypothetical protein
MLAKLKADAVAVKNYVVANYKQLGVAAVAGKFSTPLVAAVAALVKAL